MISKGQKIAIEYKERFNISEDAAEIMAKGIDRAIKHAINYDTEKKKKPKTKDEVTELILLRKQYKNFAEDNFSGRVFTKETYVKMKRLAELEEKFKNYYLHPEINK